MDDSDDQRDVELSSLSAIYPELRTVSDHDPYTIAIDVPVNPSRAITVSFPAAADGGPSFAPVLAARNGNVGALGPQAIDNDIESHELSYLPSVSLQVALLKEYPSEKPPSVTVSTSPPWLPRATAQELEADCARLWEEMGRDLVVFTFIDHVQQCADDVFGLVDDKGSLEIDPKHKIAVLDYDIKAKRAAFENGTFDCGVCLEPKKGKACHRMLDCGHVFCAHCLQDFYNNAIKEGDLAAVRCLEPSCARARSAAQTSAGKKRRKPKTFISPSELLQIPLEPDVVKRYVTLKYKTELESDKNTIYCPRPWCQGAARSKKHKKPDGLDLEDEASGSDSEAEDETGDAKEGGHAVTGKTPKRFELKDLLAICEDCNFAFCSRCYQSWHGEFIRCLPRRGKEELTAEEQASLEYVKLHTTPCPTCDCPAQKTHGCNHMICFRCNTHFCYLCSSWLDPGNPYRHFNEQPDGSRTSCYMRLWELEHGDGADVGYGFAGGPGGAVGAGGDDAVHEQAAPAEPVRLWEPVPEIEEPGGGDDEAGDDRDAGGNGGGVNIAREGPLVLRIAGNAQPARPAAPAPPAVPNPPVAGRRNNAGNNRGGRPAQPPARGGRGGRGGGRGGRTGAAAREAPQQARAQRAAANVQVIVRGPYLGLRERADGEGPGLDQLWPAPAPFEPREPPQPIQLDEAQQAWVRNFVRLALDDEEDLVESGSDEEEEIVFRVNE